MLGLFEIAANASDDNSYASSEEIVRLERLLAEYHDAPDKEQFRRRCDDEFALADWFGNRYSEYAAFRRLTVDVDLLNRDILDVGAGTGYDTARLIAAGGSVTALEYNPVLIRRGRKEVPEARWIGGFSHVLPFESGTFDVVCCNSALHHMRDVPMAMLEMLRVLRVDGYLLTMGDPFRANADDADVELEVFDRHPAVLLGVNESIPRFADLVGALEKHENRVEATLLLTDLHSGSRPVRSWMRRRLDTDLWDFSERGWLAKAAGSLAIRARVRHRVETAATTQSECALDAATYAAVLGDAHLALSTLLPLLPEAYVDRDFPGLRQTKFELLNGWRKPLPREDYRTGYKRARWFLTRQHAARTLTFRVRSTAGVDPNGTLSTYLSGNLVTTMPLTAEWSEVRVALDAIEPATRFVCELRLDPNRSEVPTFEDLCFDVSGRRFN